ncbi:MAG: hypothetical protein NXI16_01160 [Alphaproteobacteria bacterium]|nr:hypothetical protein [Alphaproteobacteria bacterium]
MTTKKLTPTQRDMLERAIEAGFVKLRHSKDEGAATRCSKAGYGRKTWTASEGSRFVINDEGRAAIAALKSVTQ